MNLRSMMFDNSVVHFDPCLYHYMDKDKENDFEQCEQAWKKKITGELMKCGIKKCFDGSYIKCSKTSIHLDKYGKDKENEEMKKESVSVNKQEEPVCSSTISQR
jgi:hypothetical protein